LGLYSTFFEPAALAAYYTARGRAYPRVRRFLEQSQWWNSEQLRAFQWSELERILQHAFRTVPYYQRKYAAAGIRLEDIRTPEDFSKLPPLTRAEVNQHRDELRSTEFSGKLLPHATGGSTGQPTRFYITLDSYDWRSAAWSRAYSWSGCRLGERTLYLWGAPVGKVSAARQTKLRTYHWLRRELVYSTFSQSAEFWDRIYAGALRFRPRFIVGYVSSIEEFAKYLLAAGRTLPGIQAVIAAGEPVLEHTRELTVKALGAPLFNTYGSREFMSIAAECPEHHGLHMNSENLYIEIDSPDGTSGEVLVTDLHNYGMPFLRYRNGDAATLDSVAECACGRGLPLIRSIEGRVVDVIRSRSGRVVPGELFPQVLKEIPEIREFQVRQRTLDELVLSVVVDGDLSLAATKLIREEIESHLHGEMNLAICQTNRLEPLPSGKRRVVVGLPTNPIESSSSNQHS